MLEQARSVAISSAGRALHRTAGLLWKEIRLIQEIVYITLITYQPYRQDSCRRKLAWRDSEAPRSKQLQCWTGCISSEMSTCCKAATGNLSPVHISRFNKTPNGPLMRTLTSVRFTWNPQRTVTKPSRHLIARHNHCDRRASWNIKWQ